MEMTKNQKMSAFLPFVINGGLFVFKLVVGIITSSSALFTDAINNLFDWISSILYWIGIRVSKKTPDEGHPLGHGRAEYITTLILGTIIAVVGFQFVFDSIIVLISPQPFVYHPLLILVSGVSLGLKLFLFGYFILRYKITSRSSQKAIAFDSLGDVLISATFLIGFSLQLIYPTVNVDGWLGLLVASVIVVNGMTITIKTAKDMLGRPISATSKHQLIRLIKEDKDIKGMHSLVFHDYGPYHKHISFHIEVSSEMSLVESHNKIDRLEQKISRQFNFECLIHIDPLMMGGPKLDKIIQPLIKSLNGWYPHKEPTIKVIEERDHPEVVLYGYDFQEFHDIVPLLSSQFPQYVFIFGETLF